MDKVHGLRLGELASELTDSGRHVGALGRKIPYISPL
jgi:hypothetical protein